MMKLRFIPAQLVQAARDVSVLTICDYYGIKYVVDKNNPGEYCLVDHDSLKIHPTKGWYWHSRQIGGNGLDFAIFYLGYAFRAAVIAVLKAAGYALSAIENAIENTIYTIGQSIRPIGYIKRFRPPKPAKSTQIVENYLINERKIDQEIVRSAIKEHKIYETTKYHQCAFVGYDTNGKQMSIALRSCIGSEKRDVKGSKKRIPFWLGNADSNAVHVFESAIDLMSFMTIEKLKGRTPSDAYIALDGVAIGAVKTWLHWHKGVKRIYVRTDKDNAGRSAFDMIRRATICKNRRVIDARPTTAHDYNDLLKSLTDGKENDRDAEIQDS